MTSSRSNKDISEDLAKSLQATTSIVQILLKELRENAIAMATLKEKLDGIEENVKYLSSVVRDGNGSKPIITRLALVEQELQDISESIEYSKGQRAEIHARISKVKDLIHVEQKSEKQFRRDKRLGLLRIIATTAPGVLALGLVVIKYFLS